MKRCRILSILTFLSAFAPAVITHAETEVLKGTKFIAVVNGNTISGKTKTGVEFHAYFLSGGIANYEDKAGKKDTGTWRMGKNDAVCVTWKGPLGGKERCAIVQMKGRTLKLEGNTRVGQVELLGRLLSEFQSRRKRGQ